MTEAVLAVRAAVRADLDALAADPAHRADAPVVVACSGGSDSVALAAAVAWVAQRRGRPAAGAVVDHGLVAGSAAIADRAARVCHDLGLDPVVVRRVDAAARPGGPGPEAAARDARYAALSDVADQLGAGAILLAHTRDDQAETVLLQLARGSGARSLAGMRPVSGLLRRPLLGVTRSVVRQSAADLGLWSHDDPQNADAAFARARVRADALPALEAALGPGVAEALARSADLLRDDADLLDGLAREAAVRLGDAPSVAELAALPRALRTRVLRQTAIDAGCVADSLTRAHVLAMEHLVLEPSARGPLSLPNGVTARRDCGRLVTSPPTPPSRPLPPQTKET